MKDKNKMELQHYELNPGHVRYQLASAGWSTFKIIVDYLLEDQRKWKIIIGVGVENIDCTYKMNVPDENGELKDVFILCDNGNYIEETVIPANLKELIFFLNKHFPKHIPTYPLKKKRK